MRTKCAISDAFVRDCVFAYCASVAQYVYSLPAEHCFRLRNNAISDERVRDCALSTHSVFRPLVLESIAPQAAQNRLLTASYQSRPWPSISFSGGVIFPRGRHLGPFAAADGRHFPIQVHTITQRRRREHGTRSGQRESTAPDLDCGVLAGLTVSARNPAPICGYFDGL